MSVDVTACLERHAEPRGVSLDASQLAAARELQRLHEDLLRSHPFRKLGLLRHLIKPRPVRGIYLWGAVGRGKSFLMDAFFACVPLERKQRVHFHRFMQEIHTRLAALKGQQNPLAQVALDIARHIRLLCLDEFHIADITDAMLMRGLLQGLFENGVAVVVTANAEPDALYRNGLQRGQFLPAIALIHSCMALVHLDGGGDYRLRALEQAGVYHVPLDEKSGLALEHVFRELVNGEIEENVPLQVDGRRIVARFQSYGVAWLEFGELCAGPRGKADYIDLARRFHTVLVSGVPRFDNQSLAQARRFLWLVDEFYDRRVKLILSAAVPLAELGHSGLLNGEFERVSSRLAEMQSHDYLAQAHQPA